MLDINMEDVVVAIQSCSSQLIFFGVVLVLGIIVMIAVVKLPKAIRGLIRGEAAIAIVLALVIAINLICTGPMSTMLSLVTGNGNITDETAAESTELCIDIAEEGIVLLENEDNILPLSSNKLNVFGWASTNPCYGGTGSGALSDAYHIVTLLEGLENAGIETNSELSDFYTAYADTHPEVGMFAQDWTLPEPPADTYGSIIDNAKSFSDTAMIVLSRVGGENADLPTDMAAVIDGSWSDGTCYTAGTYTNNSTAYDDFVAGQHYLELTQTERDMIELVCANFDNVIVVYNGANTMELGFVEEYPQIKGAIWCCGTGQAGFNALGTILTGETNPSGKTADTFLYDLTQSPTWNNAGMFNYDNMDEFTTVSRGLDTVPSFVNYVEGIYVGYRFFETAAYEGLIDYDKVVQYPFGYGLSYTTFEQTMSELNVTSTEISFDVTVKNTGSKAGKTAVEVYVNPPYTNGGIEKATANLVTFNKTDIIQPGETTTVSFTIDVENLASYDAVTAGCYVLEAGDYVISVNGDSHTVLDSKVYSVSSTVVYDENNPRPSDNIAAVNQFDSALGNVTYLSRTDGFANYAEAVAAPTSYSMADEFKAVFINNSVYNPEDYNDPNDAMPATNAKNGMKLEELRGADYDDERWETLLDNLTIDEMVEMIAIGGFQTGAAASVGKPATTDCDGPASINNNFTGVGSIGFPSAVMIACTWNPEIGHRFGQSIGKMADEMGVSGWYAPAMNTHRSAFAGRNFEYYSEDGVLGGVMATQAVLGAAESGVYGYIKHFALNDQEAHRCAMLCTWATEQAIREIYLRPFEMAVKEGHATAVMSSFNYIGTTWASGYAPLCQTVLRDEWGFRGLVETDYFGNHGYMNADQAIRNGTDIMLIAINNVTNYVTDTTSASGILAMRQACKNIMYTVVNSRAYEPENLNTGLEGWQIALIVADVVVAAVVIFWELALIKSYKKKSSGI